jgi:hypothetical protein
MSGERGGDMMPGGKGRGPRKMIFSGQRMFQGPKREHRKGTYLGCAVGLAVV